MYYKLHKIFYVDRQKYKEFSKILFTDNERYFFDNDVFCIFCGNGCSGLRQLCYNKKCYRFICNFSYNYSNKRINTKDELDLSEEKDVNKEEIELCVGIKKNANLHVLNTEIDLTNLEENEFIMMCYLKSTNGWSLDIDFDEILKFLPLIHTKYSSVKAF